MKGPGESRQKPGPVSYTHLDVYKRQLVHRIDKNTSGILVIAKNERAHARLAKQFYDHTIDRVYCALAWGNMESEEGTVTGNVGRSLKDRMKMAVFPDGTQGKRCV